MAISADTVAHRVPGRLIWQPATGSLGTYPFGDGSTTGLYLGLAEGGVALEIALSVAEDRCRQDRQRVFDVAALDVTVRLWTRLTQWDATPLAAVFPGGLISTGGVSGQPLLSVPGTLVLGVWLSGSAGRLLFAPDDETNHEFVLLRKAVCVRCKELLLGPLEPRVMEVEFVGVPDTAFATTAQAVMAKGRKSDLTV